MTTPLRRKLALAAGLLCLAVPVLSSCGFDYATDRPNVIANGGYDIGNTGLRVLAARIVAPADGQGTFVATIALNPTADAVEDAADAPKLDRVGVGPDSDYTLSAKSFSPVAVGDTGAVNMADSSAGGGVAVTGDFKAGSIVPVKLSFSDGSSVVVQTPVVTKCGDYASIAPQATGKSSSSASESGSAEAPYDCSYPSLPAIPGA